MLLDAKTSRESVFNTSVVHLWQTTAEEAEGELHSPAFGPNGADLPVRVVYEEGKRIWATVQLVNAVADEEARAKLGRDLSKLAISDPETFSMAAMDVRDGETALSATLTVDLTAAALDRWFAEVKRVLASHGDELYQLVYPDARAGRALDGDFSLDDDTLANLF